MLKLAFKFTLSFMPITGKGMGQFWAALGVSTLVVFGSCQPEKEIIPPIPNTFEWQEGGEIVGDIVGFTADSFFSVENFKFKHYLQPYETHYRTDTIVQFGLPRPLHIFQVARFDPKSGSNLRLQFALDSLGGRIRPSSALFPQQASVELIRPTDDGRILTFQTAVSGVRGRNDDIIDINGLIFNPQVHRLIGSFYFREFKGMRDTTKVYGPEIRGSFDVFLKQRLQ